MALVIFGAILVFTFGFKSPEQPPFDKLSSDDRKSTGKKRKIKEKKSPANGHVSTGEARHDKSPAKESKRSPNKEAPEPKQEKKEKKLDNKQVEKNKKNEVIKSNIIDDAKSKKNKKVTAKPVDFDDGNWETVPLKSDKKKKGDQSPAKKEKKVKKISPDKVDKVEIEKLVKEVVNKELQELDREIKEEITIVKITKKEDILKAEEPVVVVEETREEKKDKKKEKKAKKEVVEETVAPAEPKEKETVPKETVKNEKKVEKAESAPVPKTQPKEAVPVFDELGDVWTEAKAAKKSKKKARRDN